MNEFVQTGHIIYVDDRQILDPLIGKTMAGFHVTANQSVSSFDESQRTFDFEMLVDQIDIVDRSGSSVKYKIHLTDRNILGLTKNVQFSGHSKKGKKNVGQIILELFRQVGLKFNEKTISGIETNLDYITQADDNVMTAFRYLMRRDFYYGDTRSRAVNVVLYNRNSGEYGMYNVNDPSEGVEWIEAGNSLDGVSNFATLSMFDHDQLEKNLNKRNLNLETLSLKGKIGVVESFTNVNMKTFSIDGGWGEYTISPQQIQSFYSSGSPKDPRNQGVQSLLLGHERNRSTWSNDMNLYEEQVDNLINSDSLVITKEGNLARNPGMQFFVETTRP